MVQVREEIWATFIGAERRWIRERIGRIKSAEITAAVINAGVISVQRRKKVSVLTSWARTSARERGVVPVREIE
jgi:hypothetical protein